MLGTIALIDRSLHHVARTIVINASRQKAPPLPKDTTKAPAAPPTEFMPPADTTDWAIENEERQVNDSLFFAQWLEAYQSNMSKHLKKPHKRTDIVVRYYKKPKDKNRVYSLRQLGFYIHERPVSAYKNYPSNALYYGDSVKREDIALIAYQLIAHGVKLQDISVSKYHDDWKAHAIEIGTDRAALRKPPITLAELRQQWGN